MEGRAGGGGLAGMPEGFWGPPKPAKRLLFMVGTVLPLDDVLALEEAMVFAVSAIASFLFSLCMR